MHIDFRHEEDISNPVNLAVDTKNIMTDTMGNDRSIDYFVDEAYGDGRKNLVAKAVGIHGNINLLDDDDVEMIFSLCSLMHMLSRNESYQLAHVLHNVVACTRRQYESQLKSHSRRVSENRIFIKPPTTQQELRAYFCKGQNALFMNLPHPSRVL